MAEVRAYAPGRTELAGNHTDHQGGRVIAAAVDCGVELIARPNGASYVHVDSEGFASVHIDLADSSARVGERETTASLVRGVISGMKRLGCDVAGFDAEVKGTVPSGGGLSSSAAFELALAAAISCMSQEGRVLLEKPVELARVGQAAERDFFGKPCGLMDQLAVAVGGIATFDFSDVENPRIERIDFDFNQSGYALCLIDTHCDHSRYTDEYAQVARDMNEVAELLGVRVLSEVPESAFFERFEEVRAKLGDVPALRALHYYHENYLVDARVRALRCGDVDGFLSLTRQSGASSAQYLQNVSTFDRASQPAMVALALADRLLEGRGACRIHGGGFGGTVQAFVPHDRCSAFADAIDARLGAGSCKVYQIDEKGARAEWL